MSQAVSALGSPWRRSAPRERDTVAVVGKSEPVKTKETRVVRVAAEHDVVRARQDAKMLCEAVGMGRSATHHVTTAVTELGYNLFFHADRGGTITLTALRRGGDVGIEVIAEDDGPGIADVELAMRDGFTTNRGLGGGLPGLRRLMDEFEITSTVGVGTRIVARKWEPCEQTS